MLWAWVVFKLAVGLIHCTPKHTTAITDELHMFSHFLIKFHWPCHPEPALELSVWHLPLISVQLSHSWARSVNSCSVKAHTSGSACHCKKLEKMDPHPGFQESAYVASNNLHSKALDSWELGALWHSVVGSKVAGTLCVLGRYSTTAIFLTHNGIFSYYCYICGC